jgi:hypothetical protein
MASDVPRTVLDSRPDVTHTDTPANSSDQCTEYSLPERSDTYAFPCSTVSAPVGNVSSRKRPSSTVETDTVVSNFSETFLLLPVYWRGYVTIRDLCSL